MRIVRLSQFPSFSGFFKFHYHFLLNFFHFEYQVLVRRLIESGDIFRRLACKQGLPNKNKNVYSKIDDREFRKAEMISTKLKT